MMAHPSFRRLARPYLVESLSREFVTSRNDEIKIPYSAYNVGLIGPQSIINKEGLS
jgi:hypothetical protein